MAVWSEMSTAARSGAGVLGVAAVAVAGYLGWGRAPEVVAPPAAPAASVKPVAAVDVVPEGAADEPAKQVAGTGAEAAIEAAPVAAEAAAPSKAEMPAPVLDVVRVTPEGDVTIAGRAGAGEAVSFQLEGAEIAATAADGTGNFVGLFSVPPSQAARILSVVIGGAADAAQRMDVAIGPIAAPVLAEAAPATPAATPAEPVVEPTAPAALLLAPTGVKVVQPTADIPAEVAANVSVDTITYAADGAVELGGHAAANSRLRIYLDQAAVGETVSGSDGTWKVVLGEVAAGVYTLRVDQLGAVGAVTSRFETPFKRETLAALAAALQPEVPVEAVAPLDPAAPDAPAPAVPEVAAEPAAATGPVVQPAVSITVQPGYTLWGIAKQEFGDGVMYVQVFEANKDRIKNPDLIYPGQVFAIPKP